jgi:hypothetical protein
MENNQNRVPQSALSQEEMLKQILEYSRKTNTYMKWQLYITIILIVLPLLAAMFAVPVVLKELGSVYGSSGLLQ